MSERTLAEYEDAVLVNGSKVLVRAKSNKWDGYGKKEPPGIWLRTTVSSNGRDLYNEQVEITKEFSKYAKLKHQQIVSKVRKCKDLEQIAGAIKEVF